VPLISTEFSRKDRLAPPAKRPRGLASTTVPLTLAPAGIAVLPPTATESATVPEKLCPAWLILDPTDSPRRTVTAVPAGTTIGGGGAGAAGAGWAGAA